eukprot:3197550-Rhodomonas_salina.1
MRLVPVIATAFSAASPASCSPTPRTPCRHATAHRVFSEGTGVHLAGGGVQHWAGVQMQGAVSRACAAMCMCACAVSGGRVCKERG